MNEELERDIQAFGAAVARLDFAIAERLAEDAFRLAQGVGVPDDREPR